MKVAIIPARGGSKRIPRKNIRPFLGRPILGYSIETARATGLFDRIIVSTDDEEVARVARAEGAETPFLRPGELADDHTGTLPVIAHALRWLAERGCAVEYACCIYATAPLLRADDLRAAYERLITSDAQYVFSATSFPFPIQRAIRLDERNRVTPFFPEAIGLRSQDLEPAFHDAGQFYWGRSTAFLAALPVFAAHSEAFLLPRHRVQDIDTPEDWERAEYLYRALHSRQD
ncbi:MAG TPA: pseudaminic acid cytidylyltransferase [Gammaproteobacteria bacterium]|nr:pseudaminic acid cytidylyltransferase [Gammaproteobacteria bacterium]